MVEQLPARFLLDTNVFITGYRDRASVERQVLDYLAGQSEAAVLLSNVLEEELRRVGRRLKDKDWAGLVLYRIWCDYQVEYVYVPQAVMRRWEMVTGIPKEDIGIYFTAVLGGAECFVSSNRELVRDLAAKRRQLECLTCEGFVDKYIGAG